jgi:hypothetical protein
MKTKLYKCIFSVVLLFVGLLRIPYIASAAIDGYSVSKSIDGGYSINIRYSKRHLKPITAEGMFPLEKRSYIVEVKGNGKNWNYRNQNGTYYDSENVTSNLKAWDIGYAWIDNEGEYIYLNFFWISAPDDLVPSDVNGKYELPHSGQ